MERLTSISRIAIAIYDRAYRLVHGLDRPESEVGPVLRIEVKRCHRELHFTDGTTVRRGARVCILHLNNDRVTALHSKCPSPIKVGLEFRRQFLTSLRELAALTRPGGRLTGIEAFEATTIFHQGLERLGFEPACDRMSYPELVALYQRALLAYLHPPGILRLRRPAYQHAMRLWISRNRLLHLGERPAAPRRVGPPTPFQPDEAA
jgi:YkoP domain